MMQPNYNIDPFMNPNPPAKAPHVPRRARFGPRNVGTGKQPVDKDALRKARKREKQNKKANRR